MKSLKSKLFQDNKLNSLDKILGGLDYTARGSDTAGSTGYDTLNETFSKNGTSSGIDSHDTGSTTEDKPLP